MDLDQASRYPQLIKQRQRDWTIKGKERKKINKGMRSVRNKTIQTSLTLDESFSDSEGADDYSNMEDRPKDILRREKNTIL